LGVFSLLSYEKDEFLIVHNCAQVFATAATIVLGDLAITGDSDDW